MKQLIKLILSFFFKPLSCLLEKKNVVILQSSRRYLYNDNTRYLYEYLSLENTLNVFWITSSSEVKSYLRKKKFKFLSWSNPLKLIYVTLRAKVVIDNGDSFFNPFGICDCSKVYKICLSHGSGPKVTVGKSFSEKRKSIQIKNMNGFDMVNFPSEYAKKIIGIEEFQIDQKKLAVFGYPRCDIFFNIEKNKERRSQKNQASKYFSDTQKEEKILLYTPTWRPYEYDFPLSYMSQFDFEKFNNWLKENRMLFFYSTHSNNAPKNLPRGLKRIIKLDQKIDPLFDINNFMQEVDILVNDYSTTSTDFAILNRPQIFFMPDFNKYKLSKGFTEDYRKILPGKEVFDYSEFTETILEAIQNEQKYISNYETKANELLLKYFDKKNSHSLEKINAFIQKIFDMD